MHIGTIHFYNRSFPPEIRLEKESITLINAGHKVTVLTQKTDNDQSDFEEFRPNFFIKRALIKRLNIFEDIISRFTLHFKNYVPHIHPSIRK